jgi:hypothetical protein
MDMDMDILSLVYNSRPLWKAGGFLLFSFSFVRRMASSQPQPWVNSHMILTPTLYVYNNTRQGFNEDEAVGHGLDLL